MIDSLNITNGQYVQLNYQIAGTEKRIFAVLIDRIIQIIFVIMIINFLDEIPLKAYFSRNFIIFMDFIFVSVIYLMNLAQEYLFHGKTIGKFLFKIKVITEQSEPPSFQQCFIRWILYPIDLIIIGLVMLSKHGQRIGDMASGCYVVFEEKAKAVNASITTDYEYLTDSYKPKFKETELSSIKEKDINLILKGLYDLKYISQIGDVAAIICKKHNLTKKSMGTREFLIQLYNDYKYYEMIREQ